MAAPGRMHVHALLRVRANLPVWLQAGYNGLLQQVYSYLLIRRTTLSSKAAPYYTAQGVKNLKIRRAYQSG